jgi:TRAP-type C4-dicarboxylate transport system substrate-binding protein
MKRFVRLVLVVSFVLTTLMFGFRTEQAEAAPKVMLLMAGSSAATTSISQAAMRFVKRVQEDSKGEIMISFKPGGELYADKDIPTAISQGAIDLAVTNFGTWSGVVPSLVAIDLAGGVYEDVQHLYKAQAGAMGQILKADLAAKDVILVGWGDSGPTNVFLSKKKLLSHPADLKGLLVRCPNNVVRWLMEAYGATPTFASVSELYTALERNTLDGAFSAMDPSKAQKLYEAAPNVTWVMTSVSAPMGVVASKRGWAKLTPAQQDLILKAWAIEMEWNRTDVAQKNLDAWDYYTKNPKVKTHRVTDAEQKKEWDPIAREYQLKKFIELVGKEKADQLLKAIAASR